MWILARASSKTFRWSRTNVNNISWQYNQCPKLEFCSIFCLHLSFRVEEHLGYSYLKVIILYIYKFVCSLHIKNNSQYIRKPKPTHIWISHHSPLKRFDLMTTLMTLTLTSALSACGLNITQSRTHSYSTTKEDLILIRFMHEFYRVSKLCEINVRIQEV